MKNYTTKKHIENYLLIKIDDSFDEQIEEWIEAMEEHIDKQTDADFSVAPDEESGSSGYTTRYYDGTGGDRISIDPAVSIDSVSINGGGLQFFKYPANKPVTKQIGIRGVIPRGMQNVAVTARFGYDKVPKEIRFACTVLVAGIIQTTWQSEGEIQSMTIGRYTVTYKDKKQIDDFMQIQDNLKNWRNYSI